MKATIIGAGKVGRRHAEEYGALGTTVVGVCSRTRAGAEKLIRDLQFNAIPYDSVPYMLEEQEPDIVSVCSPPELHAEHTILAADTGAHLAIEKPVALTREQLHQMHERVHKAGVKTVVGFVLRWNDLIQNIKQQYLSQVGRIFYIEIDYWHGSSHTKPHARHEYGTREQPIGAFLGGGCHAVDMARHLKECNIVEIRAMTPQDKSGSAQRTTVALATFEDGTIAKISATDEVFMPYQFNIRLLGENGCIQLNKFYARSAESEKDFLTIPGTVPGSGAVAHHPFRPMIAELIKCIRSDKDTSCSLENAMNTHLACFAAEESARHHGKRIIIPNY